MTARWSTFRLGDVLEKSDSWVMIDPDLEYQEVTVRLWGKGVCLRGNKLGSEIGSSRRLQVQPGQFIVSRIDARHGAFGLIPDELDGAVVTNDFPVFTPNSDRLNTQFLGWLSKTHGFVDACKKASEGTTNRVRLKEDRFADLEIDLPTLDEQHRIVARIESLAARIDEARLLRQAIQADANAMLRSAFQQVIEGAPYRPMSEVAPIVRRKVDIEIDGEYPELGVRSFGKGVFHKPTLTGIDLPDWQKFYRIHEGDLIFNLRKAWEGSIGVAAAGDHNRVGSHNSYITCVPKEGVVTSEFLYFYFLSPDGLAQVQEGTRGSADRNRVISIGRLNQFNVPIPDYNLQLWFNRLQDRVAAIAQSQTDNPTELDALLPAILDRVFKGEL